MQLSRVLPQRGSFLIAVSGGVDSVCLLHGCLVIASKERRFEVAHVDHGLRKESGADAEFVRSIAQVPFHLHCPAPHAKGENVEAWGRRERYEFFERVRTERGLDYVLTAHTASDVAETLLMRLVSNKDFGSLAPRDERRKLIRPLIRVPRAEIERYASAHGLAWREDSSNADVTLLRNRVRHELLPLLEQRFDPRIVETLADRAAYLRELGQAMAHLVEPVTSGLGALSFGSKGWFRAVRAGLSTLPEAAKAHLIEELLLPVVGFRLGFKRSVEVAAFMEGDAKGIELPSGLRLVRHEGGLRLVRGKKE